MRKFISLSILMLAFCALAATAQELSKKEDKLQLQLGKVKGVITVKEMSGNNLGTFNCNYMVAAATRLKKGRIWRIYGTPQGEIKEGKCTYSIPNVPPGEQFIVGLMPRFSKPCDQKSFIVANTFPTELKPGETLKYDLTVLKIHCSVVK